MLKVENIETAGWRPALRGMRNPLDSWDKADSVFTHDNPWPFLGEKDEALMRRLIGQGSADHCKFRRMIAVYCDVTAPLYWWSEADTYKVGTVANSCSKMHTLMNKPFEAGMFSCEEWATITHSPVYGTHIDPVPIGSMLIDFLNGQRDLYFAARRHGQTEQAEFIWRRIVELLPESWNQKRTWMLNYETLANIYRARRNHKLKEWRDFIDTMLAELPYPWVFTGEGC